MAKIMFLVFFCFFAFKAGALPHEEKFHEPFWKKKPEAYKKIKEEEQILVSASTDEISEKPLLYQMKVVAGGAVKAPLVNTFDIIRKYEDLPKVDDHFREVKIFKDENRVYFHLEALGYHAYMHFKIIEVVKEKKKELHWECIRGHFLGMKGVLSVEELTLEQSEISMTSDYRAEKLPLPRILMGPGLEIVGRQVAIKMRDYIQKVHKGEK